jgi:hypothetical protein
MPRMYRCIMLAASIGVSGVTATAADWEGSFSSGLSAGWVSNPALIANNPRDDRLAALTFSGRATLSTELTTLTLTPRFAATRHDAERQLDTDTAALDAALARRGERSQWSLTAQALVDSTLTSELGQSGATQLNNRLESLSIGGAYQQQVTQRLSWFANAGALTNHYVEAAGTGLNDYRYLTLAAGSGWTYREGSQVALVLGADRTLPRRGEGQNAWSVSLRWTGQWSERTTWALRGGATRFDTGGGPSTGALMEASFGTRTERLDWNFSLRHDVSPIGYGLLVRKDQATMSLAARLSVRSSLNLYAALLRSEPPSRLAATRFGGSQYWQAGAEWRRRMTESLDLTASMSHVRARGGQTGGWAIGSQGRIGIAWQGRRT